MTKRDQLRRKLEAEGNGNALGHVDEVYGTAEHDDEEAEATPKPTDEQAKKRWEDDLREAVGFPTGRGEDA